MGQPTNKGGKAPQNKEGKTSQNKGGKTPQNKGNPKAKSGDKASKTNNSSGFSTVLIFLLAICIISISFSSIKSII